MRKDAVVLIVEEDSHHSEAMAEALGKAGVKVIRSDAVSHALELISQKRIDLIISDLFAGRNPDGIELLDTVRRDFTSIPVILTADSPDLEACKDAIRRGAWDFLVKPVEAKRILALAERAIPSVAVPKGASLDYVFPGVISRSPVMQSVFRVLRRVSKTDLSILIEGESGTGKELTARAIHENSHRADKPFLPINCAGLSESLLESELFGHVKGAFTGALSDRKGLFQLADKGTLFLDEIGDMPFNQQGVLLRVLQEKRITRIGGLRDIPLDVRVVCATNKDLSEEMRKGNFRSDLFYRLNVISIKIPPLRERPADITMLFECFLKTILSRMGKTVDWIQPDVFACLLNYKWPGNVRELHNVVERVVNTMNGTIVVKEHLPAEIRELPVVETCMPAANSFNDQHSELNIHKARQLGKRLSANNTKDQIANLLIKHGGNISRVAKEMSISRTTLYKKMRSS